MTSYARQLNLVEYANDYTKQTIENRGGPLGLLITPSGYPHMGQIISILQSQDQQLVNMKMIRISAADVRSDEFRSLFRGESLPQWNQFTQDVSTAIELTACSGDDLVKYQTALEQHNVLQYCHFTRQPEWFFIPGKFVSTAQIDEHSTLGILRPRILKEGQVGDVLQAILDSRFEISALELFRLDAMTAEEFWQVYRGVMPQYNELIRYMASGPCVVIEVRGQNAQQEFQEFCGPFDVEIAQILRPQSLRAKYGKSNLFNAIHCTECPEDSPLEGQYFFRTLQM